MISLRKLQLLAGLLGCYALAGVVWWHTLGCAPPTHAGVVLADPSPANAGSVTTECEIFDSDGNPLGCPFYEDQFSTINGHYGACLTASGSNFSGWTCECSVSHPTVNGNPCDLANQCYLNVFDNTVNTCVANFCNAFELTVEVIGTGTVDSDPAGIHCESDVCRSTFCDVAGPGIFPTIDLTPTERVGSGQVFAGWAGDPDCEDGVVSLDADKSCVALFRAPVLSVSTTGAGSVTGLPGLACREGSPPADCESSAPLASYVTLYADPDPAAQLMAWGGDCPDGQASSQFVMTGDLSCTATFSVPGGGGGGVIEIVSLADDESLGDGQVAVADSELSGSADLSVVAFRSSSSNLIGAPQASPLQYARDREAGTTQAISPPTFVSQSALSLSADGSFAAYEHYFLDSNLPAGYGVDVYRRDLRSDTEELISVDFPALTNGGSFPAISGNGRFVVYRADLQAAQVVGIVVRDTCSGAPPAEACAPHSTVVSYDPGGVLLPYQDGAPRISRDGRFVLVRGQRATGPGPELFLHDRDSDVDGVFDEPGDTDTIFAAPDPAGGVLDLDFFDFRHDLDASGRYVAFDSADPDLPGSLGSVGSTFLRDTCAGAPAGCVPSYAMLSVRQDGTPVDNTEQVLFSDLSGSGRYATFYTTDALLVGSTPGAFAGTVQSVLRDTCVGAPAGCTPGNVLVSRLGDGTPLPGYHYVPRVSDDGGVAVFFGERQAVIASPYGYFNEVLFTTTGLVPDPGLTPTISGRSPSSVPAGSPELLLTLTGSNFAPAAGVLWNGVARPAIFISPQKLQIRLSEADLATAGISTVRVANPGGLTSGQVAFRVN